MSAFLDTRAALKRQWWPPDPDVAARLAAERDDTVRAAGAAAADESAYAEWRRLLSRPRVPAYVTNAIPERFRARYEQEVARADA